MSLYKHVSLHSSTSKVKPWGLSFQEMREPFTVIPKTIGFIPSHLGGGLDLFSNHADSVQDNFNI